MGIVYAVAARMSYSITESAVLMLILTDCMNEYFVYIWLEPNFNFFLHYPDTSRSAVTWLLVRPTDPRLCRDWPRLARDWFATGARLVRDWFATDRDCAATDRDCA